MKLFGKSIFEKKVAPELYDFAKHGLLTMQRGYGLDEYVRFVPVDPVERAAKEKADKELEEKRAKEKLTQKTPKELYELKTLNTPELTIACDADYIDEQTTILLSKLEAIGPAPKPKKDASGNIGFNENGAVMYGRMEVESMMERLANRKQFSKFDYSEWPYTTTDAIRNLLGGQKHLEATRAESMIPDLPADAIKQINKYKLLTEKLCGKRPVFYLIKERKDDKEVARRRDPILLAQSPFGFYWQILGAWDKEVVFLDEI